ncbi:hypothetical protein VNO77_33995 [Canavalia gladiata]|uniref:Uncharacterized protein n=1 Tax=Canavalia gladiata TaxID=3824 RepID=A0AAN9KFT0_CANGL
MFRAYVNLHAWLHGTYMLSLGMMAMSDSNDISCLLKISMTTDFGSELRVHLGGICSHNRHVHGILLDARDVVEAYQNLCEPCMVSTRNMASIYLAFAGVSQCEPELARLMHDSPSLPTRIVDVLFWDILAHTSLHGNKRMVAPHP